jgi:predicted nuclease of predicted toxin-antitoxin system
MRFLADESCDFAVVRALRSEGHDVVAVAELAPRASDQSVIDLAHRQNRILLTEDKDFGRLVYVTKAKAAGIILIRFPSQRRSELARSVVTLVQTHGPRLLGTFAVLQPGRVRFDAELDE